MVFRMNWAKYLVECAVFPRRLWAFGKGRSIRPTGAFLCALGIAILSGFGPAMAQQNSYAQELQRLRQDLRDIQKYVYSESFAGGSKTDGPVPSGPPLSADAATRLHFKIQSMQAGLMTLTGRLEQIENGLRRSEDRLNRLVSDVDLRLRTLETTTGVSPGVGSSVSGGVQAPVLSGATDATPSQAGGTPGNGVVETGQLAPGQQLLGTVSSSAVENVKPGNAAPNVAPPTGGLLLKRPPLPKTAPAPGGVAAAKPSGKVMLLPDGTPKQQYTYAFGLLKKRDFPNAARSLKAFVDKNPKHSLAGNAMYWLGETHYDQKQFAEAARVFLDGYRRYPKSNKAPDNLLKLGKSLNSVGEKKSACAAWNKLLKSYPKANSRLVRSAKRSISQNKCG